MPWQSAQPFVSAEAVLVAAKVESTAKDCAGQAIRISKERTQQYPRPRAIGEVLGFEMVWIRMLSSPGT